MIFWLQWSLQLKSPTTQLFVQKLIQANSKQTSKFHIANHF